MATQGSAHAAMAAQLPAPTQRRPECVRTAIPWPFRTPDDGLVWLAGVLCNRSNPAPADQRHFRNVLPRDCDSSHIVFHGMERDGFYGAVAEETFWKPKSPCLLAVVFQHRNICAADP